MNNYLKPAELRSGAEILLTAKIPNAVDDTLAFSITATDFYAAAAPSSSGNYHQSKPVSLLKYKSALSSPRKLVAEEDAKDASTMSDTSLLDLTADQSGSTLSVEPICHGDQIVLQCDKRYLSVSRGWWLAWSSRRPRRSGVFTVEILERAVAASTVSASMSIASNILDRNFENIREKMGVVRQGPGPGPEKENESFKEGDELRHGDLFRLRNVKFPDFELGITSVRVSGDFCYLGLRKVDDANGAWCQPVRFATK
eukprot:gene4568-5805_t